MVDSPERVFQYMEGAFDPSPSQADIRATRQLREASGILQIDLLDHVIIGEREADPCGTGYYSFSESGLI